MMLCWMLLASVAGACWRSDPPAAPAPPTYAYACFPWSGGDRHGTACTTRGHCDALRDDKLAHDSFWTYGRCSHAASIACFREEHDYGQSAGIERCFATEDECERYRYHAKRRDLTRATACTLLPPRSTSALIER